MALRETERFKSYLQRDKDWLNQLYCSPNSQNDKRILNFVVKLVVIYLGLLFI